MPRHHTTSQGHQEGDEVGPGASRARGQGPAGRGGQSGGVVGGPAGGRWEGVVEEPGGET